MRRVLILLLLNLVDGGGWAHRADIGAGSGWHRAPPSSVLCPHISPKENDGGQCMFLYKVLFELYRCKEGQVQLAREKVNHALECRSKMLYNAVEAYTLVHWERRNP